MEEEDNGQLGREERRELPLQTTFDASEDFHLKPNESYAFRGRSFLEKVAQYRWKSGGND